MSLTWQTPAAMATVGRNFIAVVNGISEASEGDRIQVWVGMGEVKIGEVVLSEGQTETAVLCALRETDLGTIYCDALHSTETGIVEQTGLTQLTADETPGDVDIITPALIKTSAVMQHATVEGAAVVTPSLIRTAAVTQHPTLRVPEVLVPHVIKTAATTQHPTVVEADVITPSLIKTAAVVQHPTVGTARLRSGFVDIEFVSVRVRQEPE